jgi:gliding motility-associated-like protein
VNVVINAGQAPTITQVGPFCQDASAVNLVSSVTGGVWSGNGIVNGATGTFSPSSANIGANTITFTPSNGCSVPTTTTIVVNAVPTVNFSTPNAIGCEPFTATLVDNSTPASTSVIWDFGDGNSSTQTGSVTHTFTAPGCYNVTLTSTSNGCTSTASQSNFICVQPYADANFSLDNQELTMMNTYIQTMNSSTNATSYTWDFGDGTSSTAVNGSHEYPSEPGNYVVTLIANNPGNCPDTAWASVIVKGETIIYIPNAFTPDGDEHNNTFLPVFTAGFDPQNYLFTVYNRWGEVLFESKNTEFGWDGTYHDQKCAEGQYIWTIWYKDPETDGKHTLQGHFTLLK